MMKHPEIPHALPDPEDPDRRAFTVASILALLGGVTITISGCGGSSPTQPGAPPGGAAGVVTANHGHAAVITSAQLMGGNAVSLQIRGTATHPHTVELSAQELSQIAANQRVSKTSTTDPSPDAGIHSHVVTFN
jgi:hypothetical protein